MGSSPDRDALRGRVAVVARATRGAGRGIAAALGEGGATVVCTGRSSRTGVIRSDYNRAETIEETAELVTRLGGTGVAAAVDHLDPAQVKSLADQIRNDHGHIDVLVNDIWGGEVLKGGPTEWNAPISEHDLDNGLRILRLAIDTHLITSHHLLPLLIDKPGGVLVEVTDGTADYNASRYRLSVFYDLAKVAVNRLAFSQGHELEPHRATAVAITPGWLRSEMMLDNFGVSEESWRDALDPKRADNNQPVAPADWLRGVCGGHRSRHHSSAGPESAIKSTARSRSAEHHERMAVVKVATCQFAVSANSGVNLGYIKRQMGVAKQRGAQVGHFPDGSLSSIAPPCCSRSLPRTSSLSMRTTSGTSSRRARPKVIST